MTFGKVIQIIIIIYILIQIIFNFLNEKYVGAIILSLIFGILLSVFILINKNNKEPN